MSSNDDPVTKNTNIKYRPPSQPFEKINVSSADAVWQSRLTGSTIALNSMCQKYSDLSLKNLKENILSGTEQLRIESDTMLTFDGREAERVLATGKADGVKIRIDLLIFKKNNCTYDIAFLSKIYTVDEHKIFESFLREVHIP